MCDNQGTNKMPANKQAYRLIDTGEIKQEPDVKEEPQSHGELDEIEVAASERHAIHQPFVDLGALDSDDSEEGSIDEVKIEVKEENGKKKEKASKSSDGNSNNDAMDNQQHRSPRNIALTPQPKRGNNVARKMKKSTKGNAREKAMKQHKCDQCEYTTKYKGDLSRHLLEHTGEKPFPCDHCAKAFTRKPALMNHMKVHVKEFPFNCATCLKGFDENNDKAKHEESCKSLRYECHLCKQSFGSNKSNLLNHMHTHSGEKLFECKECSKQFTLKCNLNSHMKVHTDLGSLSFRCSKCRLRFSRQDEMIDHQQKCNRRVYACYACGKFIGIDKSLLVRHMRTHTGVKPFRCSKCPRKFNRKDILQTHMNMHSRSLPWKCLICRNGFAKMSQRNAHQSNCSRRAYECCICKKFFGSRKMNLEIHMVKHSGETSFQ